MNHPRFYSFGWIPVAVILYAFLYACPSNLGTVLFWAFMVQLLGYYTIGAGLKSPAYLAGQAQAFSKYLVFDSVHFLCGVYPPIETREGSNLWLDRPYRQKLLRMCDFWDRVSRSVTKLLSWISSVMVAIALIVFVLLMFEVVVGSAPLDLDLFQVCVVLLLCIVNYLWIVMVRSSTLHAMTQQAELLRTSVRELEWLHDFMVTVSKMPTSDEELPRVLTNPWDKHTGERERKHRAVEVVRRLLKHDCRVRVENLLAVLHKSGYSPNLRDALGADELKKLFRNCKDSWTIGALTPSGNPWRYCSRAALRNGSLKPVVWG